MGQASNRRMSREESQAQTRERLVEAARSAVVRNGFGAASIRDIAEAAGFSQGAFYSNFQGKEDVLLELMRRHMAQEVIQLTEVLDAADRSAESALEGVRRWAATLNTDADWSMFAVELQLQANRSATFAVAYGEVREVHRGQLGRIVARFFDLLELEPPDEPGQLAMGFMAMANGMALHRLSQRPDPSGRLIVLFLEGLVAIARARQVAR